MIKFDILNRLTGKVQFTAEIDCSEDTARYVKMGLAVRLGNKNKANLSGADLSESDLWRADLRRANLSGTDLWRANLSGANLSESYLSGADLSGANLRRANLSGANLWRADLRRANLSGANLSGANLSGADLSGSENIEGLIIDGGLRSDGYRFLLTRTDDSVWRVKAGCRDFPIDEARKHWNATRPKGEKLGDETRLIIKHMLAVAKLRKWEKSNEVSEPGSAE